MKFMTKEYVQQEAKKGDLPALWCSLLHHQQGRDATRGQLIDVLESGGFELGRETCACCARYEKATYCGGSKCPLYDTQCCGGVYTKAETLADMFKDNPTPDNHQAFKDAEQAVCDYIQGVIDGLEKKIAEEKKPDLRHGDEYHDGCNGVVLLKKGNMWRMEYNSETYTESNKRDMLSRIKAIGYILVGNIFDKLDDLTVLSEPLTEFEIADNPSNFGLKVDDRGHFISFKGDLGSVQVRYEDFDEFILNIRRMQATLKKSPSSDGAKS
ncbi:hypothetical protein LCGC14_0619340 [marine sediment metagenome]|uniref:Uncharacterized protein n=1 Tax=marine sediment metagenome TaxID=412755 RepID=A0A0F9RPI2_9ZZZZ|nr:hypothetical protein [Actinomycetota bacterium]